MEDDLDAMLTGTSVPTTTTPAVATTPASTAAAPLTNPPTQSTAMEAEEDEDEDEDDDDGPVALVLDAPTGAGGRGGSFGTPINIKTQRYSRWGTPATPAQPTPSPHASATPVAASPATTSTTTTFAPLIPSSTSVAATNSSHTTAPSTTATSSSRPFRLPLPNDNIFESGQHLDQRVDRPWTLPGADISDWFNYGFDEETWKLYCQKQIQQRINAKLQGKLNVFEGDDGIASQRTVPSHQQSSGQRGGMGMHGVNMNMPMMPMGMGMAQPMMINNMAQPQQQQRQQYQPQQSQLTNRIAAFDE